MSNSKLVDYVKISPNKTSPRKAKITKITPHNMAGDLSVETVGNGFSSKTRAASSNYGIDNKGRVGMYVEEKDRSWCSSSAENDNQAVTIEVANAPGASSKNGWKVTDLAFDKLVELCIDICKRNGISKLVYTGDKKGNLTRHNMFKNTSCPGPYLQSKFPELAERVNKALEGDKGHEAELAKPTVEKPKEQANKAPLYRVRKAWSDAASQIGAYTELENAKKEVDKRVGYKVYDSKGTKVYEKASTKPTAVTFKEFKVKVVVSALNYRSGAGLEKSVKGVIRDKGVYTIVDEVTLKTGGRWGKLKSGKGWINLSPNYVKPV